MKNIELYGSISIIIIIKLMNFHCFEDTSLMGRFPLTVSEKLYLYIVMMRVFECFMWKTLVSDGNVVKKYLSMRETRFGFSWIYRTSKNIENLKFPFLCDQNQFFDIWKIWNFESLLFSIRTIKDRFKSAHMSEYFLIINNRASGTSKSISRQY